MFEKIIINVGDKKIFFYSDKVLEFEIEIGKEGFSEINEGMEGDKKTPLGSYKAEFVRLPEENEEFVYTKTITPKKCLGPVFICFNTRHKGKLRGIGIHGSEDNSLKPTDGCIRMHNDDLLLIRDKIKKGIPVVIE